MAQIIVNTIMAVVCVMVGVVVIQHAANPVLGWMLLMLGLWNAWFAVEWFRESFW